MAKLLPAGAKLVKAFGTLGAGRSRRAHVVLPEPNALFYTNDDQEAGDVVADLIRASGFAPVRHRRYRSVGPDRGLWGLHESSASSGSSSLRSRRRPSL